MKKKHYFWSLLVLVLMSIQLQGQTSTPADTGRKYTYFFSALNIRSQVIENHSFMVRLNAEIPNYFKWMNAKTGKMEKLSDKSIMNEMLLTASVDYGMTPKLSLFAQIPFSFIHHYSPMGEVSGSGLSDIVAGAYYNLLGNAETTNVLTTEGSVYFPTGKTKNLTVSNYPTGLGVFRLRGDVSVLHRLNTSTIGLSGYYEYRANNDSVNVGDVLGLNILKQDYFNTSFGNFGLEYGAFSAYQFKNSKRGTDIQNTDDFSSGAVIGGYYEYLSHLFLRFDIPYTIYQNKSFLTKYQVLIQIDYRF